MYSHNLRFINLISPPKSKSMLNIVELPSSQEAVNHTVFYKYADITNNNKLINVLNPYNVSFTKMDSKVIDVVYSNYKGKNISPNLDLDTDLPVGSTKICKLYLDKKNSIYFNDGIYNNNKWINKHIDVLNYHFCKITRLGEGKCVASHFTHHPIKDYHFISEYDLNGNKMDQYISSIAFEIDENMILNLKVSNPNINNSHIYHSIMNNNYGTTQYSEISLFHLTKNKNYDYTIYLEVKEDLISCIDSAIELIGPIIN